MKEITALTPESMACSGNLWDSRTRGWDRGNTGEIKVKTREGNCQTIKGI